VGHMDLLWLAFWQGVGSAVLSLPSEGIPFRAGWEPLFQAPLDRSCPLLL
jgi:hypothetical protein